MVSIAKAVATVFGAGYSPFAPGTVGSIFGCIIIYVLSLYVDISTPLLAIGIVLCYGLGVWSAGILDSIWPHDDNRIVIDETLGIFITLLFVPYSIESLVTALVVFRFFDILKPLGIKKVDNINSVHAVMLDDVLAGVYSNIVMQVIFRWAIVTL